jgi:hypothetical protein
VLEEKVDKSDYCYSTCLFKPCLLPFYSEYDDYGGGENSSGVGLPYILDALRENLVELEVRDNRYHDIAVKRDDFNIDKFFEACHEDRLFVGSPRKIPVKFTMMRKDVVDEILIKFTMYNYMDSKSYSYGDCLEHLGDIIDKLKCRLSMSDSEGESTPVSYPALGLNKIKYALDSAGSFTEQILIGAFDSYESASSVNINDIAFSIATGKILEVDERLHNLREFLSDCLKGIFIGTFMDRTRKLWTPGGHEGSQNIDVDGHKILLSVVQGAIDYEENSRSNDNWPLYCS